VSGGAWHGGGRSYPAVPAWDGTSPSALASPYGDPHGRGADRWPDPGSAYAGGALEPLPEPGYQDRPDPYAGSGQQSWQAAEPDRLEGVSYDPAAGYDAGYGAGFALSGHDGRASYDGPAGDDPPGYGPAGTGYEPRGRHGGADYARPRHGPGEPGYQPSRYGLPDPGGELPGYGGRRPRHAHYPGRDGGFR
jgi:hypothetical protein